MKRLLTIACVCALAGTGIAFASVKSETKSSISGIEKCECGYRCYTCKGTGFISDRNCLACNGTGRNSSY